MCILFLAINEHPNYPLIICANRDEFYNRPTKAAHFWQQQKGLLAGRDLKAGGTWLGINQQGEFAALTNIRTGIQVDDTKKTRGELVTQFLHRDSKIDLQWLIDNSDQYNPFNLMYGSVKGLSCYNSQSKTLTPLNDGFHSVSNGALDDIWPKMKRGLAMLEEKVSLGGELIHESFLDVLQDKKTANSKLLPKTGIPKDWEQLLSSIFISSPEYGTRSSNILFYNRSGSVQFVEVQYDHDGVINAKNSFEVEITI